MNSVVAFSAAFAALAALYLFARRSARLKRTLAEHAAHLRAAQDELERRVVERTAELSRANDELRASNELRQTLIRCSPLAIFSQDNEERVVFWSPGAERMFGWLEGEANGRILPIVPAAGRAEFDAMLTRLRAGESIEGAEYTLLRKDGKAIESAIWAVPLRDAAGRITAFLSFLADISERKQLEAQFRQSQKLEAVGRLAGGVAHDFNNLLTVIMGYVEMVMAETRAPRSLLGHARQIQSAAERASALTGQLLAFSRRQITQPRAVDLNESVTHSMKLLRRVIGEDITIRTQLDEGLGRINADPIHIDQALMNLVVNARDAMPNGGTLTIETANVMLNDNYAGRHLGVKPGPYAMLALSDTGIGMTEEVRQRIFEPFFTTKEIGKGTGLGLSIVYGVVKQSLGDIVVYSEPARGTSFQLYFPLADSHKAIRDGHERAADLRGDETVLICEDEEHIRKLVNSMLTRRGYKVIEAHSPAAAIMMSRAYETNIDLLVTDIVMPEMSGFDLAKAIRETRPWIKVLYMSGYTDNRVNHGWVLNADTPFLQKPFAAAALAEKVRQALGAAEGKINDGTPQANEDDLVN